MEYDILRKYCTNIHLFLQLIGYIARCFCEEKKYVDEVNDGAANTILMLAAVATLLLLDDLRVVADIWAGVKRYTWGVLAPRSSSSRSCARGIWFKWGRA
jgi:hypothetical protein